MSKKCLVYYLLNEEGRKKSLLANGDGKYKQCIETEISKELLDISTVDTEGNCSTTVGFKFSTNNKFIYPIVVKTEIDKGHIYAVNNYKEPYIKDVEEVIDFSEIQTVESLLKYNKDLSLLYKKSLEENKKELIKIKDEFNNKLKELEIENKKKEEEKNLSKKLKKQKEEKRKLIKENEKKDDLDWIQKYGSDYIKQCIKLGYNCKRKYVEERIDKELSGFKIDLHDNIRYSDRVSPSQEALNEVESLLNRGYEDAEIVWLTHGLDEEDDSLDYYSDFTAKEAIILTFKNYLLVKEI